MLNHRILIIFSLTNQHRTESNFRSVQFDLILVLTELTVPSEPASHITFG